MLDPSSPSGTSNGGDPVRPGLNSNSAAGGSSGGFNPLSLALPAGIAIGSWFSNQATNDANSAEAGANRIFNAQQAEIARQYDREKTMWQAKHGYQNAVEDMRKAGLNPALMYAKGMGAESGSGGGGSAAAGVGNPVHTNTMAPALSSAIQSAQIMNDLRSTDAEILLKQAQVINQVAGAEQSTWSARRAEEEIGNIARHSRRLDWEAPAYKAEVRSRRNEAELDLEHRARERILNQVRTGVSSAADLVGAAAEARGRGGGRMRIPEGYGMWNKRTGEIYQ